MKEKILRCIFLYIFLYTFIVSSVFSQTVVRKVPENQQDFKLLKMAADCFEANQYGDALNYAQQAKQSRKQESSWKLYIVENLQRLSYIRKCGDKLSDILPLLQEHDQTEAYNVINLELTKYGYSYFHDSLSEFTQFIIDQAVYPEADYIIGKIYRLEGESDLAEEYFLSAYNERRFLDVPDQQYEILYDLADLCRYGNDLDNYEKYLLLIVKDNRFYTDQSFMDAMINLLNRQQNPEDAIEKFFLLYRCQDYFSIKALDLLCQYYMEKSDQEKALRCAALGSISAVSKIDETLKDRLIRFQYKDLGDLLDESSQFPDIVEWGNDFNVWSLMFNFGYLCKNEKPLVALEYFKILSNHMPDSYWQKQCSQQLIR